MQIAKTYYGKEARQGVQRLSEGKFDQSYAFFSFHCHKLLHTTIFPPLCTLHYITLMKLCINHIKGFYFIFSLVVNV